MNGAGQLCGNIEGVGGCLGGDVWEGIDYILLGQLGSRSVWGTSLLISALASNLRQSSQKSHPELSLPAQT